MSDFSTKQPKPQSRPSTQYGPDESGVPVTGFDEAPTYDDALHNTEVGPGVPANVKKIR
jgi:hypothetical protein